MVDTGVGDFTAVLTGVANGEYDINIKPGALRLRRTAARPQLVEAAELIANGKPKMKLIDGLRKGLDMSRVVKR